MKPGQPAEITVDTYPGVTLKGTVGSIAAGTGARFSLLPPENATGNYVKIVQRIPVKILLAREQGGHALRPGMNAIVKVRVDR
jgi:membrane fusion protein (multidrug efflux system)